MVWPVFFHFNNSFDKYSVYSFLRQGVVNPLQKCDQKVFVSDLIKKISTQSQTEFRTYAKFLTVYFFISKVIVNIIEE